MRSPARADVADATRDIANSNTRVRDPLRTALIAVVAASAVVFYFFATHGTWLPTHELPAPYSGFFTAQAQAMVHGHLDVSYQLLNGECYFHNLRCYGYYGLTPSLLRVPFLPLLDAVHSSLSAVYSTIALTLTLGASLACLYRLIAAPRTLRVRIGVVLVALALGPASVLVQLTRTAVFEEAIAWSIAFSCLGLYALLRWWDEMPPKWLALAVVCFVLSANSRPTGLVTGAVAGAGVCVHLLARRSGPRGSCRKNWMLAVALIILPAVTTVSIFELKFGAPTPNLLSDPGIMQAWWWRDILATNGNQTVGLEFVPTALVAYLRPDSVLVSAAFPFVNFHYSGFAPYARASYVLLPVGGAYIEPVSSLTSDMPIPCLFVLCGALTALPRAGRALQRLLRERNPGAVPILLLAALAGSVITVTNVAITNRYVADLYPFMMLATGVVFGRLASPLEGLHRPMWIGLVILGGIGVAWGLVVNMGLQYRLIWG